jgi:colanic acid biosynthesis glycosyl transferase WcaI
MSRVIFLNRYFFPDESASSQMLTDLAFHVAKSETDVHVITSQQLYDDHKARLPAEEVINGVKVHRVPTTRFGRSHLVGRALDYGSFYASMWRASRSIVTPNSIVVAKTDPPLISYLAMLAARRRGAHLVNWLQDIYPEVAIHLQVPFFKGPVGQLFCYLRDRSLNAAATNVVVGNGMRDTISSRGIAPERICVIHNWSDDDRIRPNGGAESHLRQKWDLQDKFVVGYSGNLGRAHEYRTVLEASKLLVDSNVVFLFIGGGHYFNELAHTVKGEGLERVFRFLPYQDRGKLNETLNVPDVHWISLRPEVDGYIVPSKFYGIAAAGKPILAITSKDCEIARLVRENRCGVVIEPGNARGLAETISKLALDERQCLAMGARARAMLDAQFTRNHGFKSWNRVFETVAQRKFALKHAGSAHRNQLITSDINRNLTAHNIE